MADQLVTVGVKHIKFWTRAGGGFTSRRGVFGKAGKLSTMLCVAFGGEDGQCFTGGASGLVYHWSGSSLKKTVEAHKGPVFAIQRVEKVPSNYTHIALYHRFLCTVHITNQAKNDIFCT